MCEKYLLDENDNFAFVMSLSVKIPTVLKSFLKLFIFFWISEGKRCYDAVIKKLVCLRRFPQGHESSPENEVGFISMSCKFSKSGNSSLLAVANEDGNIIIENQYGGMERTSFYCQYIFVLC